MIAKPNNRMTVALDRANVGERYRGVSLEAIPETCPYRGALENFIADFRYWHRQGVGLFLTGYPDRGKTSAGTIVLKHAVSQGYTGLFLEAGHLAQLVLTKKAFDSATTWYERAEMVDVLMLDDVGSEHAHDFGTSLVEALLRARYNHARMTVLTTNLVEKGKFQERYGAGLAGVVRECTIYVVVDGKDWRTERSGAIQNEFDARMTKRRAAR